MRPSQALVLHREAIRQIAESNNVRNVRVFGSTLHGTDTESSDLDLIVDPTETTSLFNIGAIQHELGKLLGVRVDVLTPRALPDKFRQKVIDEAMPV